MADLDVRVPQWGAAGAFDQARWEAALAAVDLEKLRQAIANGFFLCHSMLDEQPEPNRGGADG